ncbi:DUF5719 family protein [Protaetiibacter mangrovi]|uniref:DUF5719 family protein n=1 Tax=Protaetiibacter mangrovi TaxID=2970926 RepID=A0ABT1ZFJ6_9MICO|nr:DUF5719 family protein [Protaetiibacter mangrovi]MCS0499451.1 DUF5719 family protein [Protaetiibacter mangrovi]
MADDERPEPTPVPDEPEERTEADQEPTPVRQPRDGRGIGRTVTVVSLRVVRGLVGTAAAVVVVLAVGLVPLPSIGVEPLGTTVDPEPADLLSVCAGAALRLGDDTGANASQPYAIGVPTITDTASGTVEQTPLSLSDAGSGGTDQAPTALRVAAAADAVLAGAQAESLDGKGDLRGLAASGCAEATSSAWLVGGSTTVGRTTLLLLANPTEVAAEVSVEMWGESGRVTAPGMSGITVPAGGQRVLPLSGFAPDLTSPVVHVEARGGQVVAALQTSVIRVLDPGGIDLVSAGAAPARDVVIPAVRIFDEHGVASSLGLEDHEDLQAVVRVGNPGETTASVEVSVTPTVEGGSATSFQLEVGAGQVLETPLAAALELGADPFQDGSYTVALSSDEPVVAGVRTSTIPDPTTDADGAVQPGPADLAWAASATTLRGSVAVAIADGPDPVLVVAAVDGVARTLTLTPMDGGADVVVEVPAVGSTAVAVDAGTGYLMADADGLAVAVGFAGRGELASYPVTAPRQADSPIVIRP